MWETRQPGFIFICVFYFYLGHEGRIGMAAATLKKDAPFDGSKLYDHVVSYLPSYARPRFIRLQVIQLKQALLYFNIERCKCKQTGIVHL